MTAGSGFRQKEGRDGWINREKWARRRDLRTLLWTLNNSFLISSFCSSTSICTFHNCYLCLYRLVANHLLSGHRLFAISISSSFFVYFKAIAINYAKLLLPFVGHFHWERHLDGASPREPKMSRTRKRN